MPNFQLLDEDDNPITAVDFRTVIPGTSYFALKGEYVIVKIKNISGVEQTNIQMAIQQQTGSDAYLWVIYSIDNGFNFYQNTILNIGDFAIDEAKTLMMNIDVPSNAPLGNTDRARLTIID